MRLSRGDSLLVLNLDVSSRCWSLPTFIDMTSTTENVNHDSDPQRFHSAPLRRRGTHSTAQRILSAGLATTACIGVVGALGVRTVETGAAAQQEATQAANADLVVSSTGLTEQQLDDYAAQLQAEADRLDAYRAELRTVAASLKEGTGTSAAAETATRSVPSAATTVRKPKPKPKPKPKAAPAPAPQKPQSNTKSS